VHAGYHFLLPPHMLTEQVGYAAREALDNSAHRDAHALPDTPHVRIGAGA